MRPVTSSRWRIDRALTVSTKQSSPVTWCASTISGVVSSSCVERPVVGVRVTQPDQRGDRQPELLRIDLADVPGDHAGLLQTAHALGHRARREPDRATQLGVARAAVAQQLLHEPPVDGRGRSSAIAATYRGIHGELAVLPSDPPLRPSCRPPSVCGMSISPVLAVAPAETGRRGRLLRTAAGLPDRRRGRRRGTRLRQPRVRPAGHPQRRGVGAGPHPGRAPPADGGRSGGRTGGGAGVRHLLLGPGVQRRHAGRAGARAARAACQGDARRTRVLGPRGPSRADRAQHHDRPVDPLTAPCGC